MGKIAILLLTLAIFTMTLLAVPLISPADAATDGSTHAKRHAKKMHRGPAIQNARNQNQSPFPPMNEDPDRRPPGGGY
jgi:hypothetical protein